MTKIYATLIACLFAIINLPALAEDFGLTGHWVIEIVDREDDPFRGSITIAAPETGDEVDGERLYTAILITEDRCCDGNYSKVQQTSEIIWWGDDVTVVSTIEKFLIQDEPNPGPAYTADDFDMVIQENGTLLGRMNGWTRVRWVRKNAGMV